MTGYQTLIFIPCVLIISGMLVFVIWQMGLKRLIGGRWAIFYSIFFTPIGGVIITSLSPKLNDRIGHGYSKRNTFDVSIAILFFIMSACLLMGTTIDIYEANFGKINTGIEISITRQILFCIGFAGAGLNRLRIWTPRFQR